MRGCFYEKTMGIVLLIILVLLVGVFSVMNVDQWRLTLVYHAEFLWCLLLLLLYYGVLIAVSYQRPLSYKIK